MLKFKPKVHVPNGRTVKILSEERYGDDSGSDDDNDAVKYREEYKNKLSFNGGNINVVGNNKLQSFDFDSKSIDNEEYKPVQIENNDGSIIEEEIVIVKKKKKKGKKSSKKKKSEDSERLLE